MQDRVLEGFLRRQFEEGMALAEASDLLQLFPLEGAGPVPSRYLAVFHCRGLVWTQEAGVQEANRFDVGIAFHGDYLRTADPMQVVNLLAPRTVFHPNVLHPHEFIARVGSRQALPWTDAPAMTDPDAIPLVMCIGRLVPGTRLVDILYQVWEILTYRRVTMREDDALNHSACQWARAHQSLFPTDPRPLKRRAVALNVERIRKEGQP